MDTMHPLPSWRICQFAGAAEVDIRTARRYLNGLPLKPSTRERLEAAARRFGLFPGNSEANNA